MENCFYALNITPLLSDAALYARAAASVSPERRERIDRVSVKRERCLSLGGTLLLQTALREIGAEPPVFAYGAQEKPFPANLPGVHFNISHSGDYAVCAVSDAPVGCDIEKIKPFRENVAKRCFSPEENAALDALTDTAAKEALFFRFWTLKESFLKAVGCGITEELSSVSFDLSGETPAVRQRVSADAFFFREYHDIPGYCVSLCRTEEGPFPPLRTASLTEVL